MIRILFSHYLKSIIRNPRFETTSGIKVLIYISLAYLCFLIIVFGTEFSNIILQFYPDSDPINVFNELFIYLLVIDFILRFLFQRSKFPLIINYLNSPISRRKLIVIISLLLFVNISNLCYGLFIIPFAWVTILPEYGLHSFLLSVFGILLIMVLLTCSSFLLKNAFQRRSSYAVVPAIVILLGTIFKLCFNFDIEKYVSEFIVQFLRGNVKEISLLFLLSTILIRLSLSKIKDDWYNLIIGKGEKTKNLWNYARLQNWMSLNSYFALEINLILRNARTRSIILLPAYTILLTYIIYFFKSVNEPFAIFFWYLCLSGIWGYSYLQYSFSLESSFEKFLNTSNLDLIKYLKARYILVTIVSIFLLLFVLPVLIRNYHYLHIILSAALYNIGLAFYLVLLIAAFFKDKMDLNQSFLYNFQGNNPIKSWLIGLVFIMPLLILIFITSFLTLTVGLIIINIISLFSLGLSKIWYRLIANYVSHRKYSPKDYSLL